MTFIWFAVSCLVATIAIGLGAEDYCTDDDGNQRQLGEKWEVGVDLCECIRFQSLFQFDVDSNEVLQHCKLNGCPTDDSKTEVVTAGESFIYKGHNCTCREGTRPKFADPYTLYHGECRLFFGLVFVDF